jgi:hypothetical protein
MELSTSEETIPAAAGVGFGLVGAGMPMGFSCIVEALLL